QTEDEAGRRKLAEAARILAESAAFAQQMVTERRIPATQSRQAALDYRRAAEDDARAGGTVTFADLAGREQQGSRVDAVRAGYQSRPTATDHGREQLDPGQPATFGVMPNRTETPAAQTENHAILTDSEREKLDRLIAQKNASAASARRAG